MRTHLSFRICSPFVQGLLVFCWRASANGVTEKNYRQDFVQQLFLCKYRDLLSCCAVGWGFMPYWFPPPIQAINLSTNQPVGGHSKRQLLAED